MPTHGSRAEAVRGLSKPISQRRKILHGQTWPDECLRLRLDSNTDCPQQLLLTSGHASRVCKLSRFGVGVRFSSRFQQTASGVCLHDAAHKIAYVAFGKIAHAHATKLLLVSVVQLYRSERGGAVVQPCGCTCKFSFIIQQNSIEKDRSCIF